MFIVEATFYVTWQVARRRCRVVSALTKELSVGHRSGMYDVECIIKGILKVSLNLLCIYFMYFLKVEL